MSDGTPVCSDKKCARDRILAAAMELFYREGIRAVGVDTVIEHAGVAKMSLYRAFPSKDDLVAAVLDEMNRRYGEWWDQVVARRPGHPREQIIEIFRSLAKWTTQPKGRGCVFINTAVEFNDPQHPGRAVAERHKHEVNRRLEALAAEAGAADPQGLADQLQLLMEGAYSAGITLGPAGPSAAVVPAAEAILNAHLTQGKSARGKTA